MQKISVESDCLGTLCAQIVAGQQETLQGLVFQSLGQGLMALGSESLILDFQG